MKYQVADHVFDLTLDSKNKIYKFTTTNPEAKSYCSMVLNEEIDEALFHLSQSSAGESYLACWHTILALKSARGDKAIFFKNPKRDQLICRCMGYSLTDLKSLESRGDLKTFMRETSVGMVCTTCRPTLQAVFHKFETENFLIEGKNLQEWREIIWTLIPEFKAYSGEDIASSVVGINLIDFPSLKFMLSVPHSLFESTAKENLENRLSNFLSQKLGLKITAFLEDNP